MLLAIFEFVANLLAFESIDHTDFQLTHEFLFFVHRIINLIAKHLLRFSATTAFLHSWLFTPHALLIMTHFNTLMFAAREKPFTQSVTRGYWIGARLTLFTNELFDCVMTRRTVLDSGRVFRAGSAFVRMTGFIAVVQSAVQSLAAFLLARVLSLSAK